MKRAILQATVVGVVVLIAAFVVLRLLSIRGGLAGAPAIERPWLLAVGAVVMAMAPVAYAFLWREIVCRLDRMRPPLGDSIAVFCASWPGRYVPSSLPYLAGKFVLGIRLGHSKSALAASVIYEHALVVGAGVATSSVVLPLTLANGGHPLIFLGAGLAGAAGVALLSPGIFHRTVNLTARLLRRQPIAKERFLSTRGLLSSSAIAAVGLALNGAGFALLLNAFVGLDGPELVASAAAFNLAGAAGIAVVPVPSGLGVREAVLIGVLQLYVAPEVAAASAVGARLVGIIGDVALGLVGAGWYTLRQRSQAPVPEPAEAYAAVSSQDAA